MSKSTHEPAGRKKSIDAYMLDFLKGNLKADSGILMMAKAYVGACTDWGIDGDRAFREKFTTLSDNAWTKLRMIGNGDLHPMVMFLSDVCAVRVMRMKKEDRASFFKDADGLLVFSARKGKAEKVPYKKVKPAHLAIAVKPDGGVRTIAEQKAYVNACVGPIGNGKAVPTVPAYRVEGTTLYVNRKCMIGLNELKTIVAKMEGRG